MGGNLFTILLLNMYSAKEKLTHFHKLVSPTVVEADLEKAPHLTDFTRFDLAPEKNHEEILFLLLDHCEYDEIVRNRREFVADAADEDNDNNTAKNSSKDGNENPSGGEGGNASSKEEKAKATPKKKKKSIRK